MHEILLVNDNEEILQQLGAALAAADWTVYLANSDREVFEYCAGSEPSIVVVDMEMAAASAFDCIGAARALHPALFIVAITRGGKDRLWPGAAAVCGANEFIDGPVSAHRLAEILENGLSQYLMKSVSRAGIDDQANWMNS